MNVSLMTGLAAVGVGTVWAAAERVRQRRLLRRVPLRIHVGGARGKSTVTRMVAAGLRAAGKVTVAKTTGSVPRLILPSGADVPWKRAGPARIGEQLRLLEVAAGLRAEVLVAENMAVQREYLWAGQHKLLEAQIGVITNVRSDHLGAWGSSTEEIADSLSLSIPRGGTLVIPEEEAHPILLERARAWRTRVVTSSVADLGSHGAPPGAGGLAQNLALACRVCEVAGVPHDVALAAVSSFEEDPGASSAWRIATADGRELTCLLLFAANDPLSTMQARTQMTAELGLAAQVSGERTLNLLNVRSDRLDRTLQWCDALAADGAWSRNLMLMGDHDPPMMRLVRRRLPNFRIEGAPSDPARLLATVVAGYPAVRFVLGLGNIAGPGWDLIRHIQGRGTRLDR